MHGIRIVYKRWFRSRVVETTFPESWSEMSARQFTALYSRPNDITLLAVMLGIPKRIVRRFSRLQVYELAKLFDFVRKDTKVSRFALESVCCPGAGVLFAPKPKLAEMSFGQFMYADSYYMRYAESGSADMLPHVVAHLYSASVGYDKKTADKNVERLAGLDKATLEAVVLNYSLLRAWIAERYPLVFPPAGGKAGRQKTSESWVDVFDNLVGDDLKDRDKYAEIPVNTVFKFITRKIREARRMAS